MQRFPRMDTNSTGHKRTDMGTQDFITMNNICCLKDIIKKMNRQAPELEKIFVTHASDNI